MAAISGRDEELNFGKSSLILSTASICTSRSHARKSLVSFQQWTTLAGSSLSLSTARESHLKEVRVGVEVGAGTSDVQGQGRGRGGDRGQGGGGWGRAT